MKVLINGLPLFGRRLAKDLKEADPSSSFQFFDTYYSRWDRLRFMFKLPFCDAVISMNGVSERSGSLEAVRRFGKKLILQWQGTDVLQALDRQSKNSICRTYIDYGFHGVDSPWLMDEVRRLSVKPVWMPFKYALQKTAIRTYDRLHVVTYIAQNRQEFYGMSKVVSLALRFPDIPFDVYGCHESKTILPPNIHLKGWVEHDQFLKALYASPIFLRLTEHEGFPVSVIEAMSFGCEVMMTMPYEKVTVAQTQQEILDGFQKLVQKVNQRGLTPNEEMISIARREFNKATVIQDYLKRLREIIS